MRLQCKCDLNETDEQQEAQYINGFKYNIQDSMGLQPIWYVDQAPNLALKAERLMSRPTYDPLRSTNETTYSEEFNEDVDKYAEVEDNYSCENLVSKALVSHLNLTIEPHPRPYQIGWIKKGPTIKVTDICRLPISIGKTYKEEVIYDVLEMVTCHVLLGRLWQHDVDATHKGRKNMYIFTWEGEKIVVLPTGNNGPSVSKSEGKALLTIIESHHELYADTKETGLTFAPVVKGAEEEQTNEVHEKKPKMCDAVYKTPPRSVVDLVELLGKNDDKANKIIEDMQKTHEEVREKISQSNAKYKETADKHRRPKLFEVGDEVMVYLRKERFPVGTYSKLSQEKNGPYNILWKINDNAYIVDLPNSVSTSKTFNVSDIYKYYSQEESMYFENLRPSSSQSRGNDAEHIDDLVEAFMVKWEKDKRGQKKLNLKQA
ncbi:unnamed protein product [Lactuca virosa]|uniref:Tf2-1-like SH3-like domain-containing protein n=1 Tax=Lactuca virosa TaxID=75947 RepID=A0AAU9M431_9ASTR|nr:unnamed protein product [Lactuca virosa]